MGTGLKDHLMVISNTPNLLFSVVSNPVYGSYEMYPVASWQRPQRSARVNQAQNCIRPAGRTAAFPKERGSNRPAWHSHVATTMFSGPACGKEGTPQEASRTRGSSEARVWLCQLQSWRSHPDAETATANKQPPRQSFLKRNIMTSE